MGITTLITLADSAVMAALQAELSKYTESDIDAFLTGSGVTEFEPSEETEVGALTPEERALALLRDKLHDEMRQIQLDPKNRGRMTPPPEYERAGSLFEAVESLLWTSIRDRLNLWDAASVGFRKNGMIVKANE